VNDQNGYQVPILAILCDGKHFYFFRFIDRHRPHVQPKFCMGKFANGDRRINIDDIELNPSTDARVFVRQIRNTCESLYYVFLTGYQTGLEAYWKHSVEKGEAEGKGRESTPGWHEATVHAKDALQAALSAWDLYEQGNLAESKKSAERAVQLLANRYSWSCHLFLLVMYADMMFPPTALKRLLSRGIDFCPITRKGWRMRLNSSKMRERAKTDMCCQWLDVGVWVVCREKFCQQNGQAEWANRMVKQNGQAEWANRMVKQNGQTEWSNRMGKQNGQNSKQNR